MKTSFSIVLVSFFLFVSCNKKEETKTIPTSKDFAYLVGDWERTNDEDGKNTYEHWRTQDGQDLRGSAYTLQDGDTIFKETFRLFKKDTSWTLRIFSVHETPMDFKVTSKNHYSFTAENPANEFPSKIFYSYFDDVLTAEVSGDAMDISFIYWRIEED